MKAKEKRKLMLIDLCARLPYNVKAKIKRYKDAVIINGIGNTDDECVLIQFAKGYYTNIAPQNYVKLYLRPMSSMTEEEQRTYTSLRAHAAPFTIVNWLDENHFDHRTNMEGEHLFELGIALKAPEGMYNQKSEKL